MFVRGNMSCTQRVLAFKRLMGERANKNDTKRQIFQTIRGLSTFPKILDTAGKFGLQTCIFYYLLPPLFSSKLSLIIIINKKISLNILYLAEKHYRVVLTLSISSYSFWVDSLKLCIANIFFFILIVLLFQMWCQVRAGTCAQHRGMLPRSRREKIAGRSGGTIKHAIPDRDHRPRWLLDPTLIRFRFFNETIFFFKFSAVYHPIFDIFSKGF